ncbi:Rieske (2Fe-2S) protein [Streptomyces pathocidini]|uniref:Rieske (2Fe-2S) protein n=1 Tax=Streptomyces pathocidini TaxID=1650571 RepID=UPI003410ED14
MTESQGTGRTASRRTVVAAAGAAGLAATLAACGGETGGSSGTELAKTSDIPEGGGTIFADQKVVVTQPTAGEFKAFSAICTHAGCPVNDVSNGTINCPCHGSRFAVADGSVKAGLAKRPLPAAKITVEGDSIKLG